MAAAAPQRQRLRSRCSDQQKQQHRSAGGCRSSTRCGGVTRRTTELEEERVRVESELTVLRGPVAMEARRIGEVHYRLLEVWRSLETSASFAVKSQRGGERCKPLLSPQTACAPCRACIKRCWQRRLGYPSTRPSSTCGACACTNFSGALQSTHISRFSTPPCWAGAQPQRYSAAEALALCKVLSWMPCPSVLMCRMRRFVQRQPWHGRHH